jgi:hypothetical protein
MMRHIVVTRFSVPRPQDPGTADRHLDQGWLDRRIELFRRFFAPSVARLGVQAVVLCSDRSAQIVADGVGDLEWVQVVVQDSWYGGWTGEEGQIVTRMDSDDAVHEDWFAAVENAPPEFDVCCSREFLRFDIARSRLCAYTRREPSPLAAFRNGQNPFAHDHSDLYQHYRVYDVKGAHLLQIFHGGNVSTRRPSWYRRRLSLERLRPFGLDAKSLNR